MVPQLCGFVPTESLVAVSLRGPRKRVGLTLRMDLTDRELDVQAQDLAVRLERDGAAEVLLVLYTEQGGGPRPRAALVAAVTAALDSRGIRLQEALLVRAGRWSSYLCSSRRCCPPEGTAITSAPAVELLAAAAVLDGRVVLRDRDELVATLAAPTLLAAAAAEQRLERAFLAWSVDRAERGPDVVARAAVAAVRAALRCAPDSPRLDDEQSAALAVGLTDLRVRDEVATFALDDPDGLLGLLLTLARCTVPPYDVPVCTLVAVVAWTRGDGALANVALDRALTADPDYRMALLLRAGLDGQLPPEAVRGWLRESRRALRSPARRRGRRGGSGNVRGLA